ncbi:ATP-binding cassette domain-containing protein [Enterococcus nangangensis]
MKKNTLGIADFLKRISPIKLLGLAIVTIVNSFVSLTFVAVTTFANDLTKDSSLNDILLFCAKGLGMYIAIYVAMYLTEVLCNAILKEACLSLSQDCMESYLSTDVMTEDEITSVITQDVRMIREDYYQPLLTIPTYLFRSIIPIIYLLTQNVWVGLCFTVGAFLMLIPNQIGGKKTTRLGKDFSDSRAASLAKIVDVSKGKTTILNNDAKSSFLSKVKAALDRTETSEQRLHNFQALIFSTTGPIKGIADVLPFAIGIYLMRVDPRLTLVILMAMLATAGNLKGQFQQVIYLTEDLLGTPEVRSKIGTLLAQGKQKAQTADDNQAAQSFDELVVQHVDKAYEQKVLFTDINFKIPAGAKVLFTGESGTGKTSLFNLLVGNEKPNTGKIFLSSVGKEQPLHGNVSLIQQNPYLFNTTIRENVALGLKVSDAEVVAVLKQVELYQQLGKEPLFFLVEKNGDNLSGGQKIKIEIARALLRKRQILLADEVTASLDIDNSTKIRQLLLNLPQTVIEIAHHYQNIKYYDLQLQLANKSIQVEKLK